VGSESASHSGIAAGWSDAGDVAATNGPELRRRVAAVRDGEDAERSYPPPVRDRRRCGRASCATRTTGTARATRSRRRSRGGATDDGPGYTARPHSVTTRCAAAGVGRDSWWYRRAGGTPARLVPSLRVPVRNGGHPPRAVRSSNREPSFVRSLFFFLRHDRERERKRGDS
jgi:hypothetical protein